MQAKANGKSDGDDDPRTTSVVLLLKEAVTTPDGKHHARLAKPRWNWAFETVRVPQVIGTPQGPAQVPQHLLTGRMEITYIEDESVAMQLAAGVIQEPPEGVILHRFYPPISQTKEV